MSRAENLYTRSVNSTPEELGEIAFNLHEGIREAQGLIATYPIQEESVSKIISLLEEEFKDNVAAAAATTLNKAIEESSNPHSVAETNHILHPANLLEAGRRIESRIKSRRYAQILLPEAHLQVLSLSESTHFTTLADPEAQQASLNKSKAMNDLAVRIRKDRNDLAKIRQPRPRFD